MLTTVQIHLTKDGVTTMKPNLPHSKARRKRSNRFHKKSVWNPFRPAMFNRRLDCMVCLFRRVSQIRTWPSGAVHCSTNCYDHFLVRNSLLPPCCQNCANKLYLAICVYNLPSLCGLNSDKFIWTRGSASGCCIDRSYNDWYYNSCVCDRLWFDKIHASCVLLYFLTSLLRWTDSMHVLAT